MKKYEKHFSFKNLQKIIEWIFFEHSCFNSYSVEKFKDIWIVKFSGLIQNKVAMETFS